jgi:hypothetical protein
VWHLESLAFSHHVKILPLLALFALAPPERVQIVRSTSFSYDDEPLTFQVRVEPWPQNRHLILVATDQDGFLARRSYEQLEGERSPRTRWIVWRALPAGEYLVYAAIFEDGDDIAAKDTTYLQVLARH